jgi:TetR/AcrR family fatty acid metabolism transcriptional regulator
LTDRSIAQEEKRRLILDAAVRTFARTGYHSTRVGDIAEEAGIAYGLVYHYFASKQDLLETIFRETWSETLEALRQVEESGQSAHEQLRQVTAIFLRTWKRDPDLVRVLVREVARSPEMQRRVDEIGEVFAAVERVVERGQSTGEFRADLDARLAAWILYGAIEEILTGWVMGQLPDGDDEVARAESTVVQLVGGGLAPPAETPA